VTASREPPPGAGDPAHGEPLGDGGRWIVLLLPLPRAREGYLLVDALHRLGAHTVDREGGQVVARIFHHGPTEPLLERARGVLGALEPRLARELRWRTGSPREAARSWRREVRPIQVGARLRIAPVPSGDVGAPRGTTGTPSAPPASGSDPDPDPRSDPHRPPRSVVVRLVPGPGFGTGQHSTTRNSLRFLQEFLRPGDHVCDLGAGSGVLAIGAALLGAGQVTAIEADAAACGTLRKNTDVNDTGELTRVIHRRIVPGELASIGHFDGILANLGVDPIMALFGDFHRALRARGWLVLSGIPGADSPEVRHGAAAAGFVLETELLEEGWWTGGFRTAEPYPPDPAPGGAGG